MRSNICAVSRTGDRECPMSKSGNKRIETIRQTIEDPMSYFVETKQQERAEKYARVEQLKVMMIELPDTTVGTCIIYPLAPCK
jgi:hypothetical protein